MLKSRTTVEKLPVEVPTKRYNDAALAPAYRPIQQHELAARHISFTYFPNFVNIRP